MHSKNVSFSSNFSPPFALRRAFIETKAESSSENFFLSRYLNRTIISGFEI